MVEPASGATPALKEFRAIFVLAGPAILMQLGTMTFGVVDTLMVARVSTESLGAASLGNLWEALTLLAGSGILLGIDPLVSQAHGAGFGRRAGLALQHALVLAVLISVPVIALYALSGDALSGLGQRADLAAAAHDYLWVQWPSIPFFFGFIALRQYLLGREILMPILWTILLANFVNAFANWVLIFGNLGMPELGLVGAGISTSIVRCALFLGLGGWILAARLHHTAWPAWSHRSISRRRLARVMGLGTPITVQLIAEIGAFSAATVIAGWLGVVPLAANALALNMASVTFMISVGISMAAATRVGNLTGARRGRVVPRSAALAVAGGGGLMSISGILFATFPEELAGFYTRDLDVIAASAQILPIVGAFQIFDGVQVVCGGVLRGLGITRPAAWANIFAYWLFGLPIGYFAAVHTSAGLPGLWWALAAGLGIVAAGLGYRARLETLRVAADRSKST